LGTTTGIGHGRKVPLVTEPVSDREDRRVLVRLETRTIAWLFAVIVAAIALFSLARNNSTMFTRILSGVVLAMALDGVVQRIARKWNLTRSVAVGIVGLGLLGIGVFVALVLGPPAIKQARQFSKEIPATVEQFYDLPIIGHSLEQHDAKTKVQEWINDLPATISDEAIANTAERLVGGVFSMVVVLTTTFALLLDGDKIVNRARRLIPPTMRDEADRVGRTLLRTIGRYFGGSLTVAVLMGLFVLSLGLAFSVPLAPLAAIWAMFTDLIPQVGGFLGGAFLFILAASNSVPTALIVTVLFVIYMNLENHVISPAIVGQAVNLTPPTTMLAAFIGGAVGGVPGALVATPLAGAVKQLYLEFRFGAEPPPDRHRGAGFKRRLRSLRRRGAEPPLVERSPYTAG